MFQVVSVLVGAFDVHIASIPVAGHGTGLGPPVGPDTELGVVEPGGALEFCERFPGRFEGACGESVCVGHFFPLFSKVCSWFSIEGEVGRYEDSEV